MITELQNNNFSLEQLEHNIELVANRLAEDMIKDALSGGMGISSAHAGDILKVFYPQIAESGDELQSRIWSKSELILRNFAENENIERPLNSIHGFRKK